MVRLNRITTRGGDKGKTSLGNGKRVKKHDPRVAAFGTVDEANATLGLARLALQAAGEREADALLALVQNDLFDLGADLATPEAPAPKREALRVTARQVERLEQEVERLNAELAPLSSFVLPGGRSAAAWLHLARTVTRRAERDMTKLAEVEAVNPEAIRYINRLSDLLFVLARHQNAKGAEDVLWIPGKGRGAGS